MEQEIVIGSTISEENEKLFCEFVDTFGGYIAFVSGIQTALLNETFVENREKATLEMTRWFNRKGVNANAWNFQ